MVIRTEKYKRDHTDNYFTKQQIFEYYSETNNTNNFYIGGGLNYDGRIKHTLNIWI